LDTSDRPHAPQAILSALLRGNERFRAGQAAHPRQSVDWRMAAAQGQQPLAAVLTCADSRVAPELVFDQGLGDLYVVRDVGNPASAAIIGGIEFAVEALAVGLVLVMGHSLCAAVAAALCSLHPEVVTPVNFPQAWRSGWMADGSAAPGHLAEALAPMRPGLAGFRPSGPDPLTAAIDANVRHTVMQLGHSPLIAPRVAAGTLAVVGARYNLETGQVALLTPAPPPAE
jgi:carbonic anhydrase